MQEVTHSAHLLLIGWGVGCDVTTLPLHFIQSENTLYSLRKCKAFTEECLCRMYNILRSQCSHSAWDPEASEDHCSSGVYGKHISKNIYTWNASLGTYIELFYLLVILFLLTVSNVIIVVHIKIIKFTICISVNTHGNSKAIRMYGWGFYACMLCPTNTSNFVVFPTGFVLLTVTFLSLRICDLLIF